MSDILNANPTIRNASDLPSRRREPSKKSKSKRPFGLLSSAIPDSAYTSDPFNPSSSSEDASSDDEDEVEPIDEQEIYDIFGRRLSQERTCSAFFNSPVRIHYL
ncbi:MAG: hypothetical protein Q9211_005573 [Gyalolechia sp. 1 TL-2023]